MRFYFVLVLIFIALTSIEAGVLSNVRSFIIGTAGKVKDRLTQINERIKSTTAGIGRGSVNSTAVLDVTQESIEDTVEHLTAENDDLRRANSALRMMIRNQKRQLADLRKEKESIRRELQLRLSEVEKQHEVDKDELRKRLEQEHQGAISIVKSEMLQKVALKSQEAEAAVQLTLKQLKQIATYEEQEAASLKDIAELRRELKDKVAAMKNLEESSTTTAAQLKQQLLAKEGMIKELGLKAVGDAPVSGTSTGQRVPPARAAVEVSASGSTVRSSSNSSSDSGSEGDEVPKIDRMKDLAKKAIGGGKTGPGTGSSSGPGQVKKHRESADLESKRAPVTTSSSSMKRSSLPKKTNHKPRSTGSSSSKGPTK